MRDQTGRHGICLECDPAGTSLCHLSTKANLGTRARYQWSELAPPSSKFRFEFRREELLLSL